MASPSTPRRVAVLGGNRIPFARSNSVYADASNQDMLTAAIDGLAVRFGLEGERVGEVVAGAVLKHSRDFNLARESVLGSRLAPETPATDIQQACGTGLQATIQVANKIALGQIEVGVAGGTDTTSDAPVAISDKLRKKLMKVNAARDTRGKLTALAQIRPGDIGLSIPQNAEPRTRLSMGEHAALTALEWKIGREEQDALAVDSHQHLAAAYDDGFLDDQVTPFRGLERDQNLRPESSLEKLATLKPVFGKGEAATMTAGNSTPLTDGASVVLLASEDWASAHGHEPLAFLRASETAAVDYVHGGEGLLMAPAYAVPRMLEREGLTLQDFDFYEIHEAFASQVLATLKAWEDPVLLQGAPRPRQPARGDRPVEAQRQGLVARGRAPVRRDRRPDRQRGRQAARRAGFRPGAGLDLRRRRPGRGRDPGALTLRSPAGRARRPGPTRPCTP